ncbi:MAG: hypothetical protein HFJ28_07385 [Clostridia bacterium]|nr:hypothetical protein [Clostridia bacterium]
MQISSYAKMFGRYKQNKVYLSLDKIAGNNNLMMGFDTEGKRNYPKTLLKGDIREYILEKPCRIVGIYIKKKGEKLYKECTYIAKNIKENRFLKNNQLKEKLMINNLTKL